MTNHKLEYYTFILMGLLTFLLGAALLAITIGNALNPDISVLRAIPWVLIVFAVWICAAMFGRLAITVEEVHGE